MKQSPHTTMWSEKICWKKRARETFCADFFSNKLRGSRYSWSKLTWICMHRKYKENNSTMRWTVVGLSILHLTMHTVLTSKWAVFSSAAIQIIRPDLFYLSATLFCRFKLQLTKIILHFFNWFHKKTPLPEKNSTNGCHAADVHCKIHASQTSRCNQLFHFTRNRFKFMFHPSLLFHFSAMDFLIQIKFGYWFTAANFDWHQIFSMRTMSTNSNQNSSEESRFFSLPIHTIFPLLSYNFLICSADTGNFHFELAKHLFLISLFLR